MTTKEYLGQVKSLTIRIQDKIDEAAKWRAIAMGSNSASISEKVQTSVKHDKMGEAVVMALEYEKEASDMAKQMISLRKTIINQINSIDDIKTYHLLMLRYIDDKSLEDIGILMNTTRQHTWRLLNKAVDRFEDIYGDLYLGN